jgi:hypothetical protein
MGLFPPSPGAALAELTGFSPLSPGLSGAYIFLSQMSKTPHFPPSPQILIFVTLARNASIYSSQTVFALIC